MSEELVRLIADGQEVCVPKTKFVAVVHPGEMNVEAPDHFLIGPEQTIAAAKEISQTEWEAIRVNDTFRKWWHTLWQEVPTPEVLEKSGLGVRHSVGLMVLVSKALVERQPMHLQLPETYLHPRQCARIVTLLQAMGVKIQ